MQRRQFIRNTAITFSALAVSHQKILGSFFQQPWKITMLTDTLGIFTESGGTIAFLLGKSGIVVVDSQFVDPAKHLIEELKNRSTQTCKLLINTHHHGDHTGGNIAFKGIVEHVLAHENALKNYKTVAASQKSEEKQLFPDQTFATTWCQDFDKEKICLDYFGAGHTNGDALVHFQHANVVHMGDLLFNRRHPFVDASAGASMISWVTVLDKAIKKYDKKTTFVFGHSGTGYDVTGKVDDLKAFRDYVGNVLKFTETEMKAGKTKEEILKATEIPGSPEWKGDGIQRPLGAAYDELSKKV